MPEPDYRQILLQLIGSLTLDEHMGDVSNSVSEALTRAGFVVDWEEWPDLRSWLAQQGITTLWGTDLTPES